MIQLAAVSEFTYYSSGVLILRD